MAGTKVSSRKLRKSVKSRRVKQRGGLPNFLSMFEGRKAGDDGDVPSVTSPEEVRVVDSPDEPDGIRTGSLPPAPEKPEEPEEGGFMKKFGFGGRRSRRRASRRVRRRSRRTARRTARRTGRRVRRSRRRSNRRK